MSNQVRFRGNFPLGLTRRQIREVVYKVCSVGITGDICYTVVNKNISMEPFTLEEGVLKYAFRLSSVTLLVNWYDINPATRTEICAHHAQL